MAVVKMGQIKSTPAKALAYISRPDATADGVWVSTNAETIIDPADFKAIARQFAQTAERVGVSTSYEGQKVGGRRAREVRAATDTEVARPAVTAKAGRAVLAHHVIQSFDPKEGVDSATAHRIGVQLAEQITGGAHEYMIATHLDKGHVHNHIILNAVNRETGRKFRVQKGTIGRIREMSDELCRAQGLSVLPTPERASGLSMADIYRTIKGESGKQFIRTEIDKATSRAQSWTEFMTILGRAGVEVSARGGRHGTLSFREISMPRAVRDYRLGVAYTEASIMARLTRQVVNQIGVDVSMVTRETRETMTVVVPGTKRELHLTVAKTQIVRHGRALRIYVPASDEHRLSDARGNLAKTVPTMGLYKWFSEPDLVGATSYAKNAQLGGNLTKWQSGLSELRALEARVNAKARWMSESGRSGPDAAIGRARAFVTERHFAYQTALVAAAELMVAPTGDPTQLAGLQAQLRIIEREIDGVKTDIQALTQLTKEETVMAVSERIQAQSNVARESSERTQHQRPREQAARADERSADAVTLDDAEQDRDGGTRSMSLQERLEMEANKLRARNEDRERPEGSSRNDGRTR